MRDLLAHTAQIFFHILDRGSDYDAARHWRDRFQHLFPYFWAPTIGIGMVGRRDFARTWSPGDKQHRCGVTLPHFLA